jgi:uncharacterized protein
MLRPSLSNIVVALPGTTDVAVVNGISGAMDVLAGELVVRLGLGAPADVRSDDGVASLSAQATEYLLDRGYLTTLDPQAERVHARAEAQLREAQEFARPRKFYLMPTYACQLRCTYCFEHEVRSHGRREGWADVQIGADVAESAFEAMEAIAGPDTSARQCTLFGGEALLPENQSTVEAIVRIARRRDFGLMAATNAFDLQEYRALLGAGGIAGLHVPIDGTEATHDRMRVAKGGAPTFRRILGNLKMALAAGVRVRLRVNVNAAALIELDALADLLEAEGFFSYPRFSCYVKSIFPTKRGSTQPQQMVIRGALRERLAGSSPAPTPLAGVQARSLVTDADVARKIASSDRLSRCFSGYPVIHDRIDSLFAARPDQALRPSHCGTSSLQVLIFDPRGDIYPCNNLVGRREHRVGSFHPLLDWQEERTAIWRTRTVASMPEVAACKFALFCGGGCAFDAAVASGDVSTKSCDCDDFGATFTSMVAASYRRIVRPVGLSA